MRLERSFSSKAPGEATMKCGSYTLALVGSRQVKRDEERVKTHGEETVIEGKANYAQCHVPPLFLRSRAGTRISIPRLVIVDFPVKPVA